MRIKDWKAFAAVAILDVLSLAAHKAFPERATVTEARSLAEKAMGIKLRTSRGSFTLSDEKRVVPAIVMTARKTYPAGADPEMRVSNSLEAHGWSQSLAYDADGPYGTDFGYRKNSVTCVFNISWSPGHEDHPGWTVEQEAKAENVPHRYTVKVSCFRE